MKLIIENVATKAVIGGKDHLVGDVYKMLREYLRARPTGYHQMQQNSRKANGAYAWDGYTYFINKNGFFPTGFLDVVINYAVLNGVNIEIEDKRKNIPYFKDADWDWSTPEFDLYKHQKHLVASVSHELPDYDLYLPRGIWKAATNAGKTAAFGSLLKNTDSPSALLMVAELGLLEQHYRFYSAMFPGKVGVITSKHYKLGSMLTIAMVKTLYNRLRKHVAVQRDLKSKFNILCCDESHDFAGKESAYVINHTDAGLRLAMSGTPLDMEDKVAKFRMVGMFGTILHTVSKRYLMDKGFSMIPMISVYLNPTTSNAFNYTKEFDDIVLSSEERAELIADIVCKRRKKKCLITFNEQKHGELMYNTFCTRYPTLAHLADWVHGYDKQRKQKVQAYIDNKIRILFGSTIVSQGYNIPDIECIVNAMGGKAKTPLSQFMGRGERLNGDERYFEWIEIFDQGKWMTKHSKKRLRFLKNEDLPEPVKYMYECTRLGYPKTKKS